MGVLTGYSRRTASLNSGSGGGGGGNTIYTANDTITDNTRTVSLFGNTSSQWLKFVNLDSRNILKLKGDRTIEMGENGYNAFLKMWVDVGSNNNVILTDGTNDFVTFNANDRDVKLYNSSGTTNVLFNASAGASYINGNVAVGTNSTANASTVLDIISTTKGLGLPSMTTTQKNAISTPRAGVTVYDSTLNFPYYYNGSAWSSIGSNLGNANLTADANARTYTLFGSTSSQYVSFLNAAALNILKIQGDLSVTMYNNGGYVTNKFFNKGAIIGGNYNGSTTSDPNNVLGGSYANGVIIGGHNNTHNGYLGLIGGGGDNTIAANKLQCIALGHANDITGDYAMALSTLATVSGKYAAVIGGFQNTASGEGAVAVGGNQAIASGYRSFAQGYGSNASAHYAVSFGSYSTASARSARAVGEYCAATGVSSWVSGLGANIAGQALKASGSVSFNHSYNDGAVSNRAAEGDYSVILGGKNHWAKSGSTSSAIIGGETNIVDTSVVRSVVIGGSSQTVIDNDTVLIPSAVISGVNTYTAASVTAGNEYTLLCDATSNNITVNLPAASGRKGRIYNIKKIDSTANTVTIDANASETIDGATTQVITTQWTNVSIQSNGTNWFII